MRIVREKIQNHQYSQVNFVAVLVYKRISCTLQKGNSRQIQNRILDITHTTANMNDECFDRFIDQQKNNIDTMIAQ